MVSQLNSKRLILWSDIATTHQQERNQDFYLLQYTKSELASRLTCQKGGMTISQMVGMGARLHGVGMGVEVSRETSHWNVTQ